MKPDSAQVGVYQIGQEVWLVPTMGCYQKSLNGTVTSLTPTQVGVTRRDGVVEVRYRITDGQPVSKRHRQFPCYAVRVSLET